MTDNYTDLREALKKTFVARNITAIVLKGDLRDNQPCDYEIPFDLFADFITQRETAARIDELSYFYEDEDGEARRFQVDENDKEVLGINDRLAELKTLTKPDKE